MKLKVGSLFSGIGGLDLGLERAGMTVRWQSEIDPYASRVLAKHWPNVPNLGDITTIDWSQVEPVDLICGGYPCQPFSLAGNRAGADDARHLWPYFHRAIRDLRPRYALLENVPGHLSMGFDRVLGDLAEIGYDTEWCSIPAAAMGAPHLRWRLFAIAYAHAYANGGRQSGHTEASNGRHEVHGGQYGFVDAERLGSAVPDTPRHANPQHSRGTLGRSRRTCASGSAWTSDQWRTVEPDVGGTLDGFSAWLERSDRPHKLDLAYGNASEAGPSEELRLLRHHLESSTPQEREVGGSRSVSASAVLFAYVRQLAAQHGEEGHVSLASEEAPEAGVRGVRTGQESPRPPRQRRSIRQRSDQSSDSLRPLSQLLARDAESAWSAYRRESAATVLGGWPSGWEDGYARIAHGVPHRVDRLRCLGNAVVPQVAEWIGRRIVGAAA